MDPEYWYEIRVHVMPTMCCVFHVHTQTRMIKYTDQETLHLVLQIYK